MVQKCPIQDEIGMFCSKMGCKNGTTVACYPRISTEATFTLLICFNRFSGCCRARFHPAPSDWPPRAEGRCRPHPAETEMAETMSAAVTAPDQDRRSFRNFSRKRPDTTNLNHQYAIRRAFIAFDPRCLRRPFRRGIAQASTGACDLLHNRRRPASPRTTSRGSRRQPARSIFRRPTRAMDRSIAGADRIPSRRLSTMYSAVPAISRS